MASPTAVNDQFTDAVTQDNVKVLGGAPAMAMGNLYVVSTACAAQILRCAGLDRELILGLKPKSDRCNASNEDKSRGEEQT